MSAQNVTPERMAELVAAEAELKRQKEIKTARARQWYADHKNELKIRYEANKEARANYYEANKERILEQQRRRYYERKAVYVLAPPLNVEPK
jgi:hypothetical protein